MPFISLEDRGSGRRLCHVSSEGRGGGVIEGEMLNLSIELSSYFTLLRYEIRMQLYSPRRRPIVYYIRPHVPPTPVVSFVPPLVNVKTSADSRERRKKNKKGMPSGAKGGGG